MLQDTCKEDSEDFVQDPKMFVTVVFHCTDLCIESGMCFVQSHNLTSSRPYAYGVATL